MAKGVRRTYHPSLERVRELFLYDPVTGLVRAKTNRRLAKAGDIIGTKHNKGYLSVNIDGENWYLHNIAWFLIHEEWPTADIDHIDANRSNNAIRNLRHGSRSHNNANWVTTNNKHGVRGVYYMNNRAKPWVARIHMRRKCIHLGCFSTEEEAGAAYREAARHYFGDFARGN
jgi:hypothetical protein